MDKEEASVSLSNSVYEATALIEKLEHAGKVSGNGHHIRQKIAEYAAQVLRDRWIEKKGGE